MSTRSFITVYRAKSKDYATVYCHSDGYPSGVGEMLAKFYSTQALAEKLVRGGDLSELGPDCGTPPTSHAFDNRIPGYCVYYRRDRKEKNCKAVISNSLQNAWDDCNPSPHREYHYFWNGNAWVMLEEPKEPVQVSIADAIAKEARETAEYEHLRALRAAKEKAIFDAHETSLKAEMACVPMHRRVAVQCRLDATLKDALQRLRDGDYDAGLLAETPFPG